MRRFVIEGRFVKGLGRGKYFMRQKEYKRQFIKKLGIDPYHGTLNVRLSGMNLRRLSTIKKTKGIVIKGFKRGNSTFGGVTCYKASISGIKCALVIPERTSHTNIAEIVSSEMLRRKLEIKEGDKVMITLPL